MAKKVISQPTFLWVRIGVVTEDDAGFLQAADAAQAGQRRGCRRGLGELDVGRPGSIGLEFRQYAQWSIATRMGGSP